ncbi:YybH family protein [Nonomuraea endophytica]|uniref:YybH family protein n=1 Tax=Nonomuraea endophytica TaxID=714136 RepID=UPI0037C98A1B
MNLEQWIADYVRAWNTNDPAGIAALFTEDASYYTEPHAQPWHGRDAIVAGWLANQDEPGQTSFTWQPLTVTGDLAIVQGTTVYPDRTFSNLWVIRFGQDGGCREFTEWWMEHHPR